MSEKYMNVSQKSEKELTPADVAKILEIAYSKAKRLMRTNEIRSWVDTNASDGRKYLKTIHREVLAYHSRKLELREAEFENSKKQSRKMIRKRNISQLSDKSIDEFFRTEIFNS